MVSGEPDGTVRFRTDVNLTITHANYPFPPSFDLLDHTKTGLADEAAHQASFTATDWGVGLNMYIFGVKIFFESTSEWNKNVDEAVLYFFQRTSDSDFIWTESFFQRPFKTATEYQLLLMKWLTVPIRVASTDTLRAEARNYSGQTIDVRNGILYFTEDS